MPLYALPVTEPDAAAEKLGSALGLSLEQRESSYWGDYCLYCGEENSKIRIYRNEDPLYEAGTDPECDKYFEPDFSGYSVLLHVDAAPELLSRLRVSMTQLFPGAVQVPDRSDDE